MKFDSPQEQIARQRQLVNGCRAIAAKVQPWFIDFTEKGRTYVHSQITELDITAQYDDYEDKLVALFASLSAKVGCEEFCCCNAFNGIQPKQMVYKRLFTEAQPSPYYSTARFKEIMDRLWLWAHDYYSIADAVDLILDSQDPLEQTIWMMEDSVKVQRLEYRLSRLLMTMTLNDGGIGQNICKCNHTDCIGVPVDNRLIYFRSKFVQLGIMTWGEIADAFGLTRETDLYYLAVWWDKMRKDYPVEARHVEQVYALMIKKGMGDPLTRKRMRAVLNACDWT